jgi:hypothetical protein
MQAFLLRYSVPWPRRDSWISEPGLLVHEGFGKSREPSEEQLSSILRYSTAATVVISEKVFPLLKVERNSMREVGISRLGDGNC